MTLGDLSNYAVESMRHGNEVTVTARRYGVTFIFRTSAEGWLVTKMHGGRRLDQAVLVHLPTEVRRKIPTHHHRRPARLALEAT